MLQLPDLPLEGVEKNSDEGKKENSHPECIVSRGSRRCDHMLRCTTQVRGQPGRSTDQALQVISGE